MPQARLNACLSDHSVTAPLRLRRAGKVEGGLPELPSPFFVDQRALCVPAGAQGGAMASVDAVRVIVTAAEQGLYVGPEAAVYLSESGVNWAALAASERGGLLVDLLLGEQPADAVELSTRLGLICHIVPDLDRLRAMPRRPGLYKDVYTHTLRVIAATPADLITRLAALLHDIAKPDTLVIDGGSAHFPNHDLLGADRAARRLRGLGFEDEITAGVETLVRLHLRANSYEPTWTDSAVRRLHLDAGAHWQRLLDLSHADVTSARPEAVARARRRVQDLAAHAAGLEKPVEVCPLNGNDLMRRFQREPGPWIGEVKLHLLDLVRSGSLEPDDQDGAWAAASAHLRDGNSSRMSTTLADTPK